MSRTQAPLCITMHPADNVAIVANDGGLPAGTVLPIRPDAARQACRRGTRSRWSICAEGAAVRRYNVAIGHALRAIPAGSWVHERLLRHAGGACADDLPIATVRPAALAPLDGYTFEGYRNADGSVGTRNILAITTTVQCVAGRRRLRGRAASRPNCCRAIPNVDDVVGLEHTLRLRRRDRCARRAIPIRTLRNISLNPNFGGEVMVVSLGCEKLQPERLLPPGRRSRRRRADAWPGRRLPAGRRARRLHVDDRFDHATGDAAPRAAERAAPRDRAGIGAGRRRAMRRQRCVFRASPRTRRSASAPTCWCAPAPP